MEGRTDGTAVAAYCSATVAWLRYSLKVLVYLSRAARYPEQHCCGKAARPRTLILLATVKRRGRGVWSTGGMIVVTGENRRTGREEEPAQCQFVYHKSHTDRPGIEPRPAK